MAQQTVSMNRLKDGVIAGFRVTEIKTYNADIETQDQSTGMIRKTTWTKIQVRLTHDASLTMSQKDPYAVENIDPAHPLVLNLHTFLVPQQAIDGVAQMPRPADKAPSSDKMRWAFIKYDTFQKILHYGGYIPKSKPVQKFPLPGAVFIECALSGGNNYPRKIGGPDLIEEKRVAQEEMTECLDAIFSMGGSAAATDETSTADSLDALSSIPSPKDEKEEKKNKRAKDN